MNGDWIALDIEPDVCCGLNGIDCTCALEEVHIQQLKLSKFKLYNVCCTVDEIERKVTSKVGIEGDQTTHFFTTQEIGDNQWLHSFT